MKNLFFAAAFLFVSVMALAGQPDHSIWDRYLHEYVTEGGSVNYKAMKLRTDSLDAYLKQLMSHPVATDWTDDQKKAYYINAYNAFTIKFVLEKYPVTSPKDISFSGKDMWSFRMVQLGTTVNYTLNQVENDILRKMNDPRIHFAINCASVSCPKLSKTAFTPENVDAQLTTLTKAFINDPKKNVIGEKKVELSEIFSMYPEDFTMDSKTLIDFLNQYSTVTIRPDAKIEYLPYNWALNGN